MKDDSKRLVSNGSLTFVVNKIFDRLPGKFGRIFSSGTSWKFRFYERRHLRKCGLGVSISVPVGSPEQNG